MEDCGEVDQGLDVRRETYAPLKRSLGKSRFKDLSIPDIDI